MKRKHESGVNRRFSVAPMMDWTDRHERFFLRLLTARTLLYTEMVTSMAIIHGDRERLLGYNAQEHPVALQLGGSEPEEVAEAARIGADFGYDEINLNVGCPSDRVQSGRFGACLMKEPALVARIVEAMQKAVSVPVTLKCRLGVDEQEPRNVLPAFIETMKGAGITSVTVHARKAWLKGLSPKENRTVPPLDYGLVHEMKEAFPEMEIIINGGIRNLDEAAAHLEHVDGVMMGRAAYETPYVLAEADNRIFGEDTPVLSRGEVVRAFLPYAHSQQSKGVPLHAMTRHILGLFQGVPGARAWRRHLSENAVKPGAGISVVEEALSLVDDPAPAMTEA